MDGFDSSTAFCSAFMSAACCLDRASEWECVKNDNFIKLWLCSMEASGCSFDERTCGEESSTSGSSRESTSSVSHPLHAALVSVFFAAVLPLL